MKKTMIIVLIVAVLMVAVGIVGNFVLNNNYRNRISSDYTNYSYEKMMGNTYIADKDNSGEKIELDVLEDIVVKYINQYDENLVISDIFLFDDSDYYFSIIEENTSLAAMELLVNPYTGDVYPEFGPNMMWNQKYGMHNNSGYGMMGNRGMMGRNNMKGYQSTDASIRNEISHNEAQELASEYIDKSYSNEYMVSKDGHEFYGYYTFHIEDENNTVGMLSVNGFTGEVWYHDWHSIVTEVIDGHKENDDH